MHRIDEIALLYFAGHGSIEATGGYLCASDSRTGDDGLPLGEVMTFVNESRAQNKVIFLDSCHSGVIAAIRPASKRRKSAEGDDDPHGFDRANSMRPRTNGSGVFTALLVDALRGAAVRPRRATLRPGAIYAHIDQSLGPWRQRPVFKRRT